MAEEKIISDELGLTFSILENNSEVKGVDCIEANAVGVNKLATILKSSLGPNGFDKIIMDQDDQITITNDGRTIVENYIDAEGVNAPSLLLTKQLSESLDAEIGDGTTSIILIANELLQNSIKLIKLGIHPIKVTEGLYKAVGYALDYGKTQLAKKVKKDDLYDICVKAATTSLNSKVASNFKGLGKLCTDAVFSILPKDNTESLDLEKISVKIMKGKSMNETEMIKGVLLEKETVISDKMKEAISNREECKIALLACPFEPPKLKNKGSLLIETPDDYSQLSEYEKETFVSMIKSIKESGADVVLCQWGFDDEATSLLLENDLPAVRWVPGNELGLLASLTGGQIVSRFEDVCSDVLGKGKIRFRSEGTENKHFINITNESNNSSVTSILVKSSNKFISAEIERSITDSLCTIRSIIADPHIVYGGGSFEVSMYVNVSNLKKEGIHILHLLEAEEHHCFKAFANSLLIIPETLSVNAGHKSDYVEGLINKVLEDNSTILGIDCFGNEKYKDMKVEGVFESLSSKIRQYSMAVDFVNNILKVNEAINKHL